MMHTVWKLTIAQLRMYVRDRQSVFFALFFPLIFMLALGFVVSDSSVDPIDVGVVAPETEPAAQLVETLAAQELLTVHEENEADARHALEENDRRVYRKCEFDRSAYRSY